MQEFKKKNKQNNNTKIDAVDHAKTKFKSDFT